MGSVTVQDHAFAGMVMLGNFVKFLENSSVSSLIQTPTSLESGVPVGQPLRFTWTSVVNDVKDL